MDTDYKTQYTVHIIIVAYSAFGRQRVSSTMFGNTGAMLAALRLDNGPCRQQHTFAFALHANENYRNGEGMRE